MFRWSALFFCLFSFAYASEHSCADDAKYSVPTTVKKEVIDNYHGTLVSDPYRWLEAGKDDPSVQKWIDEQRAYTESYLSQFSEREVLKQRLNELWKNDTESAPNKVGNLYFYFKRLADQEQPVLYYKKDIRSSEEFVALDPIEFSVAGTASITTYEPSPDGRYLAYGISFAGSDWVTIKIRDLASGKDLDEDIAWAKFTSIAWTDDSLGFFYTRFPAEGFEAPNTHNKVYHHRIGDKADKDILVFETPDHPEWSFSVNISSDGKLLLIDAVESTENKNLLFYERLENGSVATSPIKPLVSEYEAGLSMVASQGDEVWFWTNYQAPNGKVVKLTLPKRDLKPGEWKSLIEDVIPHSNLPLESVKRSKDKLIASYLKDAASELRVYDLNGNFEKTLELPERGYVSEVRATSKSSEVFVTFYSFFVPSTVYQLDSSSDQRSVIFEAKTKFDRNKYEWKQVFYPSKDGTLVPMFILSKKGVELNGKNPTFLYGYGGFDISIPPEYRVQYLVILEQGGVVAVPNLRGGGEYGEDWHQAGMLNRKQNVFDDFIAAAEWLINHKYTSPEHLGIHGRSNGGLLVGATMTQRPDLFKVAVPGVGVLDMLRYQLFTAGRYWVGEYGSSANPDQFPFLYSYSPLHNAKPANYPATLVITSDHDDRVVPAHSFKFGATLQENQQGDLPVLIRIEKDAGHGAGRPIYKLVDEWSDVLAFFFKYTR
ncbi:MAG: prolyl oligopeptidase family protein [Bacteriovoracia bacterium]